jgi:hypothetical protein
MLKRGDTRLVHPFNNRANMISTLRQCPGPSREWTNGAFPVPSSTPGAFIAHPAAYSVSLFTTHLVTGVVAPVDAHRAHCALWSRTNCAQISRLSRARTRAARQLRHGRELQRLAKEYEDRAASLKKSPSLPSNPEGPSPVVQQQRHQTVRQNVTLIPSPQPSTKTGQVHKHAKLCAPRSVVSPVRPSAHAHPSFTDRASQSQLGGSDLWRFPAFCFVASWPSRPQG